jgi:hypothetical protein
LPASTDPCGGVVKWDGADEVKEYLLFVTLFGPNLENFTGLDQVMRKRAPEVDLDVKTSLEPGYCHFS